MEQRIISKRSDATLALDINQNARKLPCDMISDIKDTYDLYNQERESSTKYRLIFGVFPYCSNVLFNPLTEIVQNEGSSKTVVLGDSGQFVSSTATPFNPNYTSLTREKAIADTEYSHEKLGNFKYHCGIDIFANHTLRSTGFSPVTLPSSPDGNFNTYDDIEYTYDGSPVKTYMQDAVVYDGETCTVKRYDETNSYTSITECFKDKLIERDGWYGFKNPSSLKIPMGDSGIYLNMCMNANKPCEHYDLYPDRELYSFLPKVNKYRNGREEYNWDYCITYPYKEEYNPNGCNYVYDEDNDIHGILIVGVEESELNSLSILYCYTALNHNLQEGDSVILYSVSEDGEVQEASGNVNTLGDSTGNNKARCFSIYIRGEIEDLDIPEDNINMRVRKNTGIGCDYYFRVFKKLTHADGSDLLSVCGKAGYTRTGYGDEVAQIIFNEDIDISGLTDNRGRNLSELYLTIVKRHKGEKLWYENKNYTSEDIEYSHCFTEVKSGIDIPMNEDWYEMFGNTLKEYNVHCIHKSQVSVLENDITIDNDTFYGDIVEWDPVDCTETKITEVKHRFNTYQREYGDTVGLTSTFLPKLSKAVFKEGYYYNPHQLVTIREWGDSDFYYDTKLEYDTPSYVEDKTYSIRLVTENGLLPGDTLYLRYINGEYSLKCFSATVISVTDNRYITFTVTEDFEEFQEDVESELDVSPFFDLAMSIFIPNTDMPQNAQYVANSEGKYLCREVKTYETSSDELANSIFANGAHYFERNVNLFVRRQDPFGVYQLRPLEDDALFDYIVAGDEIDYPDTDYIEEKDMKTCNF